jgi:hypothetical protein
MRGLSNPTVRYSIDSISSSNYLCPIWVHCLVVVIVVHCLVPQTTIAQGKSLWLQKTIVALAQNELRKGRSRTNHSFEASVGQPGQSV